MRLVLAGATGFLGRPLLARLAADGHDVTVLTRRPRGQSGARELAWQPEGHAGPWASALDGADAVVNLAGESIADGRWTPARKLTLLESRLLPTRSLVAAIERCERRPTVLVNASAIGFYGTHGDEVITEANPPGHDFLGRLARDWEDAALAAEALGTRVFLLRTGVVLARDGGALGKMLLPFRLGLGGRMGTGRQYLSWIHRDDWVRLVGFLLAHPGGSGPVNATAPAPVPQEEFARTLARVLRRPAIVPTPGFVLRLAMGEMADALVLAGQRVVPARALEMGFRFSFPELEPALVDLLRA